MFGRFHDIAASERRASDDNPLWGAPRIHGELLKLGFEIAQSSVAKYMVKRSWPPSQGWRTFLRRDLRNVVANYPFERSRDYSRLSCGIEETQLGPRAAGSRQASDRALDDQAAGAQHISLSEARRRVPASSAPHPKQLAGAEHGGGHPPTGKRRNNICDTPSP